MSKPTNRRLKAIQKRIDKLPPGPWVIRHSPIMGRFLDCGGGIDSSKAKRRLAKMSGPEELLKFAAFARVEMPILMAEVARLRKRLKELGE